MRPLPLDRVVVSIPGPHNALLFSNRGWPVVLPTLFSLQDVTTCAILHRVFSPVSLSLPLPCFLIALSLYSLYLQRHGYGIFTCSIDGYRYEGEWLAGRRHGTGTIFLPNGDRFTGLWKDGRIAGPVDYKFAEDSPWASPDL